MARATATGTAASDHARWRGEGVRRGIGGEGTKRWGVLTPSVGALPRYEVGAQPPEVAPPDRPEHRGRHQRPQRAPQPGGEDQVLLPREAGAAGPEARPAGGGRPP